MRFGLGARLGGSFGVLLWVAMATTRAEARRAAPQTPPDATPAAVESPEGAPPADSTGPTDAVVPEPVEAAPDADEQALRTMLAEHEAAPEVELAELEADAQRLDEFLAARRKARAVAQIEHALDVPEVPQDLVDARERLEIRIEEERAAAEELASSAVQEPAVVAVPTVAPRVPMRRPRHRIIYSNLSAVRYNPLGLVNEFTAGYRYQLINKRSLLFNESFVAAQLHTYVSPAYMRIGPKIDIQPLALLNLSATYDFTGYLGTFGLMQSFQSPTDDWSDTELERRDDSGDPAQDNYTTTGHFVTLSALLQAKVGRVAVRDNLKAYWSSYDLRAGDTVSYDQTLDITIPNRGWAMTNDLDLLYLFDFGLTLGARYTLTQAFYQPRHFQAAEPISRPNGPTHRVGPAMLYTFFDRPHQRFNKPTLIVLMQWWAAHRYRTGEDVSVGIPYFVLGFRFEGDIYPDPATWNHKKERKRRRRSR